MIRVLGKIPNKITIAVSGGPDSMAALDFLSRRRDVSAAFFHHDTDASEKGFSLVKTYCEKHGIEFSAAFLDRARRVEKSQEEFWREERYRFFESLDTEVITCHHLDDAVEWWIFSAMHGNPKLIPYQRPGYLRPFLLNKKTVLIDWCRRHNVPYINDPSNRDPIYMRSHIRRNVIPPILKVNPGIHKVIKKKILDSYNS